MDVCALFGKRLQILQVPKQHVCAFQILLIRNIVQKQREIYLWKAKQIWNIKELLK
jgi:hypothetical protein